MKHPLSLVLAAVLCANAADKAEFTDSGDLIKPSNYREWVFLSSGLGMTYGPNQPAANAPRRFDNVFVNPSSYRAFLQTGKWPDGTVLVLEIRESESKGSINQHGHFQTSVVAVEANVKDSKRFADGGWAFFDLGRMDDAKPAKPIAAGNGCQKCHSANGAVDSTFVQFYPELVPVAKKFGTFKNAQQ
jgi:hypothetical protein